VTAKPDDCRFGFPCRIDTAGEVKGKPNVPFLGKVAKRREVRQVLSPASEMPATECDQEPAFPTDELSRLLDARDEGGGLEQPIALPSQVEGHQ
jgi:hypothetical protein